MVLLCCCCCFFFKSRTSYQSAKELEQTFLLIFETIRFEKINKAQCLKPDSKKFPIDDRHLERIYISQIFTDLVPPQLFVIRGKNGLSLPNAEAASNPMGIFDLLVHRKTILNREREFTIKGARNRERKNYFFLN